MPSVSRSYEASGAQIDTKISTHVAATDPHGDRSNTTSQISTHTGATDPHGDRGYTDTRVATRQRQAIIDARDFGVVADDSTDDTASLQSAINAAQAAGNAVVRLPAENLCKTTSKLQITASGVGLIGHAIGRSGIHFTPASGTEPAILISGADANNMIRRIRLQDFSIRSGNALTHAGVEVSYTSGLTIRECEVLSFYGHGIHLHDHVYHSRIIDNEITQNGVATSDCNLFGISNINGIIIRGNRFREAGDADQKGSPAYGNGIRISGIGIEISGENIFEKHLYAIHVGYTERNRGIKITGNYLEWNTSIGIFLDGDGSPVTGFSINNNYIDVTKAAYGVYLDHAYGGLVSGNHFEDENGHVATGCVWSFAEVKNCHFGPNYIYTSGATPPVHVGGNSLKYNAVTEEGVVCLGDAATAAPTATIGLGKLYIDPSDGDLKVIFGDGTIKTIATDT